MDGPTKEIICEGNLTKRAIKSANNWKLRWFKLWRRPGKAPMLTYHKNKKKNSEALGCVVLGKGTTMMIGRSSINKKDSTTLRITLVPVTADQYPSGGIKIKNKKKASKKQPSELLVYGEQYAGICDWKRLIEEELDLVFPHHSSDEEDSPKAKTESSPPTPAAAAAIQRLSQDLSSDSEDTIEDIPVVVKSKQRTAKEIEDFVRAGRGHMGDLFKKRKKVWTKKYFVLEGAVLSYYDSPTDFYLSPTMPKRRIYLCKNNEAGRVFAMPPEKKTAPNTVGFCIVDLPRVGGKYHHRYSLCAKTLAERDSWVRSIAREIKIAVEGDPDSKNRAMTAKDLRISWQRANRITSYGSTGHKPPAIIEESFKPPMMGDASPKARVTKPPMMGEKSPVAGRPPLMTGGPSAPPPMMGGTPSVPPSRPPALSSVSTAPPPPPLSETLDSVPPSRPASLSSVSSAPPPPPLSESAGLASPGFSSSPASNMSSPAPPPKPRRSRKRILYKARYKYKATQEDEMTFKKGDVFECRPIEEEDEDAWLEARAPGTDNEWLLVPANYMMPLNPQI